MTYLRHPHFKLAVPSCVIRCITYRTVILLTPRRTWSRYEFSFSLPHHLRSNCLCTISRRWIRGLLSLTFHSIYVKIYVSNVESDSSPAIFSFYSSSFVFEMPIFKYQYILQLNFWGNWIVRRLVNSNVYESITTWNTYYSTKLNNTCCLCFNL